MKKSDVFDEEVLVKKIKKLSEEKVKEVLDFVEFLIKKEDDVSGITQLSESAFKHIWDNEEDAIYDNL